MQTFTVSHWRTRLTSAAHLGLTASIAVWLAVFAPMLCQYHGLMWNHTHMDEMSADDATWDVTTPAMDMSGMTMTAAEHQEHLRRTATKHTAAESLEQHAQHTVLFQAVLPLNDTATSSSASLYNPVPTIATILVSIMLIHSPSQLLAVTRDNAPIRLQPEASRFPLQLAVPPLEQPPRL